MDDYIKEALAVSHICLSTSPAVAGFFFVEKRTVAYTPALITELPLVPAALEQLQEACIFTKLDLQNDILIYSSSLTEHIQHVHTVLTHLKQHELYIKMEKCEFHRSTLSFQGYVLSPECMAMDQAKVKAITDWPEPTSVKELQWFRGFTSPACKAFTRLKQSFTTAPILHLPDPKTPFVVEVDASNSGIGVVLSQ
ncbi:hypothetical protein QTP86_028295 [Hemibagrus guttatus]|nr:hypothetical protein QTP86_028295 [Hemibagrus guttatus]